MKGQRAGISLVEVLYTKGQGNPSLGLRKGPRGLKDEFYDFYFFIDGE